jgi:hypothetical protein
MLCTNVSACTFCDESAVACVPSLLTSQPPFSTMNAPSRSRVSPVASGVIPAAFSFFDTVISWSHVVGISASVRWAFAQRSVLISSASVEKSLGMQ